MANVETSNVDDLADSLLELTVESRADMIKRIRDDSDWDLAFRDAYLALCKEEKTKIVQVLSETIEMLSREGGNVQFRDNVAFLTKISTILREFEPDSDDGGTIARILLQIDTLLKSDTELKRAREREEALLRAFPSKKTQGGETMSV